MIICVKCGNENEDICQRCAKCGRKLQSGRGSAPDRPGGPVLGEPAVSGEPDVPGESSYSFEPEGGRKNLYLHHAEPWIYVAVVLGALLASFRSMSLWPLYVLAPAVALIAWLRRI